MQHFLSGVAVISGPVNFKTWKNDEFNSFCDFHESTSHDTISSFTLLELQKHIEDNNNEELYSIRHFRRILPKRYGAQGSKEVNSIVTYTILDSSVGAAAKIVKESLRDDQQTKLTEGTDRFFIYIEWPESRKTDCWSTSTTENVPWYNLF